MLVVKKGNPDGFHPLRQILGEKRNLSIAGKVCIIETFLISQFTNIIQARVVPDSVLTQANRLLFRFLRRKKECNPKTFEKVKRTVVCGALENGGLYMIDLKQMQTSFLLQMGWTFVPSTGAR